MAQASMDIHQISVTYQPEQDRMLVRVSTRGGSEFRLWLTRRLLLGLWPLLNQSLADQVLRAEASSTSGVLPADPQLRGMLADFRRGSLLDPADFATPYAEGHLDQPLGAEPLLVTEIGLTPRTGGLSISFAEKLPGREKATRGFSADMDPRLAQGLVHLLAQALEHADWRLQALPVATATAGASDDGPDSQPRWLN